MPDRKFTLSRAVEDFQLTVVEGDRFRPEVAPVKPMPLLSDTLQETRPWAIAVSSEKARSEGTINPVLLAVKRQLQGRISVFSGEEFNVQSEWDLTGYVDFLISRSSEQLFVKTPAMILTDYPLPPVERILGFLVWMAQSG